VTYRFAEFEADDREFRLLSGGTPVQMEPKVLRLLLCLIENRNRLMRKQELLDKVWFDAAVTEYVLTRAIGLLRKALNDDSHVPRFIETVPTAGYRFVAKVTVVEEDTAVEPGVTATGAVGLPVSNGTRGPKGRRRWIAAGIPVLVAVGAGIFFFAHHRKAVPAERAAVVLADFDNRTNDPVFDGTLRQGLAMQFEQPPFLMLTNERIQAVLRGMGQPVDARLTPAIAYEICVRTSSAVVMDGSIANLGSEYVLGLRATDCPSGRVIADEQIQAARKEEVLGTLDGMSRRLGARVGKWLTTAGGYDLPIFEATTPSMEALKLYTIGQKKLYAGDSASLLFYQRAVELDPTFAAAYQAIALVHSNRQEPQRAAEAIRRAYELREKTGELERRVIEVNYYILGTGELEKAERPLKMIEEAAPRAPQPRNNLGNVYRRQGDYERATREVKEALQRDPNNPLYYQNLGADYVSLNRLADADAVYKDAETRGVVGEGSARSRYLLAFLMNDEAQMKKSASLTAGKLGEEDAMLAAQAETAAWHGRLNDARDLTRRAIESAHRNDVEETAGAYQAALALFEVESGNPKQGLADAHAAMTLSPTRDVKEIAALALARAGDLMGAEKVATEIGKSFPVDTLVQRYWLPTINATVALGRKDPERALHLLQIANPIELSNPRMLPAYLRGEAYLMLHDGKRAEVEFLKFIDHRGLVRNSPSGALGRLGLARAYAMQKDTTKAHIAYRDFLELWKDADLDIPLFNKVKTESATL
jgi:DNA-binding winged helix-turn-helix (wHTH) protein/tetratricopeptide (TPR) repeat protein